MTDMINIDVTGWGEHAKRHEIMPIDLEEMTLLLLNGIPARKIAEAYLWGRAFGDAKADALKADKPLLSDGALLNFNKNVASIKAMFEINNKVVSARSIVGMMRLPDEDDGAEMETETAGGDGDGDDGSDWAKVELGNERASEIRWDYVRRYLPGAIWNSLVIFAVCSGMEEAEECTRFLHDKIDELMDRLRAENGNDS